MQLSDKQIANFRQLVWDYYAKSARPMPWRQNPEPYWVLVSEIMLQQTQVGRVLPKFEAFVRRFPSIDALASAGLDEVLRAWSGLGYNRRAKFLWQAAQVTRDKFGGILPPVLTELTTLPGIGPNTAGAILAYAYNQPAVFIETNIRTVFIHHFFAGKTAVSDSVLRNIVSQTLDQHNPRLWYWALMDYGTHLKQTAGNNIAQSKHYAKQSAFVGSRRQLRGQILKVLSDGPLPLTQLAVRVQDERLDLVIEQLKREGLVVTANNILSLGTGSAS